MYPSCSQTLAVLHKAQGCYYPSVQKKNCETEAEILELLRHADTSVLAKFYVEANCLSSQKSSVTELKTESQSSLNPEPSALFLPM